MEYFSWDELEEAVLDAFRRAQDVTGIDFQVREHRLDEINDEYGRETLRFDLYFIGAHPRPNPRSVQLDITRNETVVFLPRVRKVHHEFSDADDADDWSWRCYALEEILAEKLRAVLGQRRKRIRPRTPRGAWSNRWPHGEKSERPQIGPSSPTTTAPPPYGGVNGV